MSNDIFERVKKVTIKKIDVKPDEVTMETNFMEDLAADSLDVVELVMALEEEFSIQIPDEDANDIKTVASAVEYIEKKLA